VFWKYHISFGSHDPTLLWYCENAISGRTEIYGKFFFVARKVAIYFTHKIGYHGTVIDFRTTWIVDHGQILSSSNWTEVKTKTCMFFAGQITITSKKEEASNEIHILLLQEHVSKKGFPQDSKNKNTIKIPKSRPN
jgi:hypothetical protein